MSHPDHPVTAILSTHARQRCTEMCIPTKRVKRLLRNPSVNHVARDGRWIATSRDEPHIAVVYAITDGQPIVVTVLWSTQESYDRATYRP